MGELKVRELKKNLLKSKIRRTDCLQIFWEFLKIFGQIETSSLPEFYQNFSNILTEKMVVFLFSDSGHAQMELFKMRLERKNKFFS